MPSNQPVALAGKEMPFSTTTWVMSIELVEVQSAAETVMRVGFAGRCQLDESERKWLPDEVAGPLLQDSLPARRNAQPR